MAIDVQADRLEHPSGSTCSHKSILLSYRGFIVILDANAAFEEVVRCHCITVV